MPPYDKLMFSDIRDAVFQGNPFVHVKEPGLYVMHSLHLDAFPFLPLSHTAPLPSTQLCDHGGAAKDHYGVWLEPRLGERLLWRLHPEPSGRQGYFLQWNLARHMGCRVAVRVELSSAACLSLSLGVSLSLSLSVCVALSLDLSLHLTRSLSLTTLLPPCRAQVHQTDERRAAVQLL